MKIHYFVHRFFEKCFDLYFTFRCNISAKLWGVKIKYAKFSGRTHFRKYPGSIIKIGNNCLFNSSRYSNQVGIYSPCLISTINSKGRIEIGHNCGFSGTVISSALSITIGDNVRCGANTLITDTDYHTDDLRTGIDAPVIIEDNVWLGYGVKVLKGVHIGKGSMIGAGSIVTKDIPAGVIAAGIPCKIIKEIK